jgi:NADH-quinone oxidoreductase subunit N
MIPFQPSDLVRILPEVVLSGFAILIMIAEPFVAAEHKSRLGWLALGGVVASALAAVRTSLSHGSLGFGGSVRRDHIDHGEFYALVLMATVGACFMVSCTELIMIFIGLEISSISTYVLAGFKRQDPFSNESSLKYFLLGSFATAFFLYGIAFVYGLTGTTNLMILNERLASPSQWSPLLWLAMILMFVGLAFKVSTVPFQVWTPDVYQGAPAPVTAFLSVAPKAAAFAVLLRIFLGGLASFQVLGFWILWLSAVLTMSVGNLAALWQSNVKRMLAYSAIAHAGYVLVGITAAATGGNSEGISSVLFYLASYALMNVGAFVLVAHLSGAGERWLEMEAYTGLAYERPGVAACLTVFLLSLAGFPTTAGFFAKFYVFRAAVHTHLIGLTIVALLNGVVSVYYYLRLVVMMYMREGKTQASTAPLRWPLGVALAVTLLGIFCLGLYPGPLVSLATLAASPLP